MKRIKAFWARIAPAANFLRIAFWILALFLGTGFLFLLSSMFRLPEQLTIPPTRSPEYPEYNFKENFQNVLTNRNHKILSREVKISLSESEMKAEFILVVPSTERIASEITGGVWQDEILPFIELVFGQITKPTAEDDILIFDDPLSYEVTWTIDARAETLRFIATAREPITSDFAYVYYTPSTFLPTPEHDKLLILFDGFQIASMSPVSAAADLSSNRLMIEEKNKSLPKTTSFFRLTNSDGAADSSEEPGAMERQYILQDLDDWLESIPLVSAMLFAILEALPLLLFLRLRRSDTGAGWTNTLTVIAFTASAFLVYHFVLYLLSGSIDLFSTSGTIRSAVQGVIDKLGFRDLHLSSIPLTTSPRYFGIVVLGIWIPVIFFNWWGIRPPAFNERYPIINMILFYAICILLAHSWFWFFDQYMLAHHERYFRISPNEIFSYTLPQILLLVFLIISAGIIWLQYWDNRKKNRLSWLAWLDKTALFLIGWVLWIPLIVAMAGTLSIYSIESIEVEPTTWTSIVAYFASIIPLWMWIILLASITGLFLLMAMRYLTRGYIADRLRFKAARYSVGLLLIFAYLRENKLDLTRFHLPETLEWTVLLTIFGTLLVASLGFLLLEAIARLSHGAVSSISHGKWVWVLALALALPVNVLISSWKDQTTAFSNLFTLAYTLDNLLVFLWLGGVAWYLREHGKANRKISKLTYEIGILAAATVLFSVTARWFFIPITFIVGWLCLRYLIRKDQDWEQLNNVYQYVRKNRTLLLDRIININAVQPSIDDFRKRAIERFSKSSKTTFAQFDRSILEKREKLDRQVARSFVFETHPKDLVFAFGPFESSWRNATHGAVWALIFAIPWLALYIKEFLTVSEVPYTYMSLKYLVNILNISFYWVGMGFFFGHFFPYIRGASGVSKGFKLFVAIFVASLPVAMLYRESSEDWRALLFWGLQVFIEYMLLGLIAFDYWTLRRDGRGWQMLFDVHGIAKLGISVSTILAAIGATLITLLTSQATNLIGISLKFIFPDLPPDFLPK